jgi:hypothetical protein
MPVPRPHIRSLLNLRLSAPLFAPPPPPSTTLTPIPPAAAYYLKDWSLERLGRVSKAGGGEGNPLPHPLERIRGAQNVGVVIVGDEVLLGKVFLSFFFCDVIM